ncbi:MAG: DoxX family protein [Muribaculaceae bacterium]|nr:DoxX family protein [Muribaculaceae bacterium]
MNTSGILTISVNPAASTVGSLHPEACVNRMRRKVDIEGANLARRKSGAILRTIFGATSLAPAWSLLLQAVRIACGAFMIYNGISMGSFQLEAVFSMAVGMMLVLGLATRFVMVLSALVYGVSSGLLIETGQLPVEMISIAVVSVFLAVVGPGRYSLDAVLRRYIFRKVRRYETRKLMENRFSYRAYQYAREF